MVAHLCLVTPASRSIRAISRVLCVLTCGRSRCGRAGHLDDARDVAPDQFGIEDQRRAEDGRGVGEAIGGVHGITIGSLRRRRYIPQPRVARLCERTLGADSAIHDHTPKGLYSSVLYNPFGVMSLGCPAYPGCAEAATLGCGIEPHRGQDCSAGATTFPVGGNTTLRGNDSPTSRTLRSSVRAPPSPRRRLSRRRRVFGRRRHSGRACC